VPSVPVVAPRHSSTVWYIGDSTARASSAAGSWSIGKNVPENRNIGMIRSRKISGNGLSLSWAAEYAASGAAIASAPYAAAGAASTPQGDTTAPRAAATTTNRVALISARTDTHVTNPSYTSRGVSGVAAAAWNHLIHLVPAMTGHRQPPAAYCTPEAARMPGATNTR
jgi:hypothetical protein